MYEISMRSRVNILYDIIKEYAYDVSQPQMTNNVMWD